MIVEIMFTLNIVLLGFVLLLLFKTPALAFLRGKTIIARENADKTLEFIVGKRCGNLVETREGYYLIEPSHTLIEERSKKPIILVYSRYATPLTIELAKYAEELKKLGIKRYEDLEMLKKQGVEKIEIKGESVELSKIVDLFNNTERADYIKGEIENRVASVTIQKLGGFGIDLFKLGIFAFLIMIAIGIVYFLVSGNVISLPGQAQTPQPQIIAPQPPPENITAPVVIK